MNLRYIDWIWHVSGSLALAPGQSSDEAFARLDTLFGQRGTTHDRSGDTLTFQKKDQAAQDKMSVFDSGVLQIEPAADGGILRYRLASRILLFCFLAPLLFFGIGQLTIALGAWSKPSAEAAAKAEAAKKKDVDKPDVPMNPIDKALGAPEPDKKPVTKAEKAKAEQEKAEKKAKRYSPTAAYVFAAMFAFLYVVGRILEDRLIKSVFRKRLRLETQSLP